MKLKFDGKPKVAFICVHNSCRSQIAEAFGKKYLSDTLEMRGEVGPFGRSQFWNKATKEEALSIK